MLDRSFRTTGCAVFGTCRRDCGAGQVWRGVRVRGGRGRGGRWRTSSSSSSVARAARASVRAARSWARTRRTWSRAVMASTRKVWRVSPSSASAWWISSRMDASMRADTWTSGGVGSDLDRCDARAMNPGTYRCGGLSAHTSACTHLLATGCRRGYGVCGPFGEGGCVDVDLQARCVVLRARTARSRGVFGGGGFGNG